MRIKQLDGVRAVAIALVVLEHGLNLPMGWAGVDLFFVLSGFLITRILRRTKEEPYYWTRFYIKRATRILPPMMLALLLSAIFYRPNLGAWWIAYLLFGSNISRVFHSEISGRWDVFWSLAVEEHFYLIWPIAIRYLRRRSLLILLICVVLAEPVIRGFATPHVSFLAIYFLTPFRLDGLAAGAFLALALESERDAARIRSLSVPLLCASTALLVLCTFYVPGFNRRANSLAFNSVGYSFVALISVSAIAFVLLRPNSLATRLLSLKPVVFIGVISYGIYLFHHVILDLVASVSLPKAMFALQVSAAFAITLFFCWLSFRWFESPVIAWGHAKASHLAPGAADGKAQTQANAG